MKNLITIGLPSKGRLKEGAVHFFKKNNYELTSNGGERNYFAENCNNVSIDIKGFDDRIHNYIDATLVTKNNVNEFTITKSTNIDEILKKLF